MKLEFRVVGLVVLALGALALAVAPVVGQDDMSEEEMMQAMMEAGKPGPHHEHLAQFVGTWKVESRFWMDPEESPMTSTGRGKNEMILGGRFLHVSYEGNIMGMQFEGFGVMGFNNLTDKYESNWVDNMSSMIYQSTGTCDDAGKKWVMVGHGVDPMTGEKKSTREVLEIHSRDKHVISWYEKGPDGKEFKSGEMVYTRAASN